MCSSVGRKDSRSFAHRATTIWEPDKGWLRAGDSGYGILLYTGSPDSEGTLGGLVEIGRKIDQHLRSAIELGRLCSNDPVCAQHSAKQPLEERFLLGAACHGCLLISETSCERFNQYLDRSLVVATVGAAGAEFFNDQDTALL